MNVRYLVPYGPRDAAVRERVHRWSDRLRANGYETSVGVGFRSIFATSESKPDSVVVFRHLSSWAQGWPEARALRTAPQPIYELDDGLPVDNGHLPEIGVWWKRAFPKSRIARRAASAARRIVVGNEMLADWASTFCDDVRIIPTCIDPNDYTVKQDYEIGSTPTIVWIGSAATEVHLLSITDALERVHRSTGARLMLIGAEGRVVPSAIRSFTDKVSWSPSALSVLGSADVGIMPLPDRPYERHKCAYKLLQYGASGLPIVGSPVGMSERVLERCGAAMPRNVDEWHDALVAEITAPAHLRSEKGRAAFAYITKEFSFERWSGDYIGAVSP